MELTLIDQLNESKMYRTKASLRQVDARRCADHAFMDLLTLWVLYNDYDYSVKAMEYAAKTVQFNNFNQYRQMGTDLYVNLHVLLNNRTDLLGDNMKDNVLLDRLNLDHRLIIQYLRYMAYNKLSDTRVLTTLQKVERQLHIENAAYRSIRRVVQGWLRLDHSSRKTAITRMLMYYRTNAYRSELFPPLLALAKMNNLVDRNAKNPERGGLTKAVAAGAAGLGGGVLAGWQLGKSLV